MTWQVVGVSSSTALNYWDHLVLYSGGNLQDLGTFGGVSSEAVAINNKGEVLGYYVDADGANHYFLYNNGQVTDIVSQIANGAGWTSFSIDGFNDNDQIIGTATINGVTDGFLLTPEAAPVPIPPTFLMLGGGLAGLGLLRRRFFRV